MKWLAGAWERVTGCWLFNEPLIVGFVLGLIFGVISTLIVIQ